MGRWLLQNIIFLGIPNCSHHRDAHNAQQTSERVGVMIIFDCLIQSMECQTDTESLWGVGGALVESTPFVRRVMGSTLALAAM